jgi:hypothetical protein
MGEQLHVLKLLDCGIFERNAAPDGGSWGAAGLGFLTVSGVHPIFAVGRGGAIPRPTHPRAPICDALCKCTTTAVLAIHAVSVAS